MKKKILVLGIGNLLMGDEGIGIHVIREFESKHQFKNLVDVVDGGTGGFHLLSYLQEYENVIIVDAAIGDRVSGSIEIIKPKYSSDFPRTLTAHDIGLKDLIDSAAILGQLPEIILIIIYIDKFQSLNLELSDDVKAAIPKVVEILNQIISQKLQNQD